MYKVSIGKELFEAAIGADVCSELLNDFETYRASMGKELFEAAVGAGVCSEVLDKLDVFCRCETEYI